MSFIEKIYRYENFIAGPEQGVNATNRQPSVIDTSEQVREFTGTLRYIA